MGVHRSDGGYTLMSRMRAITAVPVIR